MNTISAADSDSSDELGFLADLMFVEEEKNTTRFSINNSETTVYDSQYDDASSTSESEIVTPKRPRQNRDTRTPTERLQIKREKNRIGAKNTRVKKKLYLENLQAAISRLTDENDSLNAQILCLNRALNNSSQSLFAQVESAITDISSSSSSSSAPALPTARAVSASDCNKSHKRALVLTNPALSDNPVVFASQGFLSLTGYELSEILGKNPRILQGPGTDPHLVNMLGHNVKFGSPVTARLLNFKKGRSPFFNRLNIAPLKDGKGRVVFFVGTMCEDSVKMSS